MIARTDAEDLAREAIARYVDVCNCETAEERAASLLLMHERLEQMAVSQRHDGCMVRALRLEAADLARIMRARNPIPLPNT